MASGNQAWGDVINPSTPLTDASYARWLGVKRVQLASDAELRNLDANGDIADPGERVWVLASHLAGEATAWVRGNSIQRDNAAPATWAGELTSAAAPGADSILGLAQYAAATSALSYNWLGRSGPFEALSDGTINAYESAVATGDGATNGLVAGVAFGAATDAHIGHALEDALVGVLATVVLDLA